MASAVKTAVAPPLRYVPTGLSTKLCFLPAQFVYIFRYDSHNKQRLFLFVPANRNAEFLM